MRLVARREFLAGAAAYMTVSAAAVLGACAPPNQSGPPKRRRIGLLVTNPLTDPTFTEHLDALRAGLRELGHVDGENFEFDMRSANGQPERFPEHAAELVASGPDVIFTAQIQSAVALKNATTDIPIVFSGIDPSTLGIANLSRPGGNLTGLATLEAGQVAAKRLQLLKETVPSALRIAVVWNADAGSKELAVLENAASQLGVRLETHAIRSTDDLDGALAAVASSRAHALMINTPILALPRRSQIAEFTLQHGLPSMHPRREFVEDGALLSYGSNPRRTWRRAATYIDRILKGAQPADLPVEDGAMFFEFVVNLCTAARLGLAIPATVLSQVSEAIECGR